MNIVGRIQNNNYENADHMMVYGLTLICEEIDYLETREEAEARRAKEGGKASVEAVANGASSKANGGLRKPAKATASQPNLGERLKSLVGPADRNRTCICRLGGGRSIH